MSAEDTGFASDTEAEQEEKGSCEPFKSSTSLASCSSFEIAKSSEPQGTGVISSAGVGSISDTGLTAHMAGQDYLTGPPLNRLTASLKVN